MSDSLESLHKFYGFPAKAVQESAQAKGLAPNEFNELPPLDKDRLYELRRLFQNNPDEVLKYFNDVVPLGLTKDELKEWIDRGIYAAEHQAEHIQKERMKQVEFAQQVPNELLNLLKYQKDIPVTMNEIDSHKYEDETDWFRWLFWCGGPQVLTSINNNHPIKISEVHFPSHEEFASRFVYSLTDRAGKSLEDSFSIVLFADFGTGWYNSLYIAKQIEELIAQPDGPKFAIHLGDVYYAGREDEVKRNLEKPLANVVSKVPFFTMNSNHEMLSWGRYYFEYINRKRKTTPAKTDGELSIQPQEGSYFCLRNNKYQIIALDTDYDERKRYREPKIVMWLADRIAETGDRTTILLTPDAPYEAGKAAARDLLNDILPLFKAAGKKIRVWFWGDDHYCAFFEPTDVTPFYGSCIGHAGYPVVRKKILDMQNKNDALQNKQIGKAKWVDDGYRFPNGQWRKDLANAGFCVLRIDPTGIKVIYKDWLGSTCRTELV